MHLHPEKVRPRPERVPWGGKEEDRGRKARAPAPAAWGARIKVWISLAVAAGLVAASVAFLVLQLRGRAKETQAPSATPVPLAEYPWGSPTEPDPYRRPEEVARHGGDFPRWNLKEFPEGWNPALAREIHAYFESMSVAYTDEEKLARLRELREQFREFLASLGPQAVPTLAAILNAEGDFVHRRFILDALGNLGPQSEAATFVLRDFFMARYADPRNESEMIHVIDAMAHLKNDTSYGTLRDLIQSPDGGIEAYRRHFVAALGEHPRREESIDVFAERLHAQNEESKNVRNMAAQALGKIRSPDTLNELYRAAQEETYFAVKQTILGSIGKIGNPNSIPFLEEQYRQALSEPQTEDPIRKRDNVRIRQSAARAMSRIGTPYAQQVLRELVKGEPDESTRGYMERWISEASQAGSTGH